MNNDDAEEQQQQEEEEIIDRLLGASEANEHVITDEREMMRLLDGGEVDEEKPAEREKEVEANTEEAGEGQQNDLVGEGNEI